MARYAEAVAWIANNDERKKVEVAEVERLTTVVMVAELWHKEPSEVAADVIRARKRFTT